MKINKIEKVILGHNPFFGVDHLSGEAGNEKDQKFENEGLILDVLNHCNSLGVNAMMMSTHPRAKVISDIIGREPSLQNWTLYPLIPYVMKYVRQSNEKGLFNVVADIISQTTLTEKFSLFFKGAKGVLGKDIEDLIPVLVDVEMLPFKGRNLGAIFLHDALVDLALGLGIESVLEIFRKHVEKKYDTRPAFITKNVPLFRERVEKLGWSNYLVMASFNKTGFYVNPSVEEVAKEIERPGMDFIAMSTLSGGAVKPGEAYEFISRYPSIKSVVVGMSKKEHVTETVEAVNKYIK